MSGIVVTSITDGADMDTATQTKTPRQIAKRLSDHCMNGGGFYPSTGGRAFGARVRNGALQITYDFERWTVIDHEATTFTDGNGRPV